jgi:hypothetical protein
MFEIQRNKQCHNYPFQNVEDSYGDKCENLHFFVGRTIIITKVKCFTSKFNDDNGPRFVIKVIKRLQV